MEQVIRDRIGVLLALFRAFHAMKRRIHGAGCC